MLASKGLKMPVLSEEQQKGVDIVVTACTEPIRQMAMNSGQSPDIIISQIMSETNGKGKGYDFKNDKWVDLLSTGIIDPVKVTCCALKNAVSAAGTLITTNYAIIEIE